MEPFVRRTFLYVILAAFPVSAAAQSVDPDCRIAEDQFGDPGACASFLGCFQGTGTFFTGKAYGWNEGTLAATTSSGAICTGEWVSENALGVGQAIFECDDGQTGTAYFTYQDGPTGTATGHGLSSKLGRIRVWSGNNIEQYLKNETGAVNPKLMCGEAEIPIS